LDSATPAVYFVLGSILREIANDWADRPVQVEEAQKLQTQMIEPLVDLITALDVGESDTELFLLTNAVVVAYISYLKP